MKALALRIQNVICTPGVQSSVLASDTSELVGRFLDHDWGEVDEHDRALNDQNPKEALGVYTVVTGCFGEPVKVWVKSNAVFVAPQYDGTYNPISFLTELHKATIGSDTITLTVLLPEEY